jgi:Tfp pilus assembly protein PilF
MQNSNNLTTAHSLLHGGLATEAVEFLANIVAKDPQCVEAWHTKAVAHSKIQPTQWQEAIEALEKCISLHPERRSAYALDIKELGNVLYKQKDYPNAVLVYSKAILQQPDASFYANRAAAYFELRDYDAAIEDCNSSLQLSPNVTKVLLRKAKALLQKSSHCEVYDPLIRAYQLGHQHEDLIPLLQAIQKAFQQQLGMKLPAFRVDLPLFLHNKFYVGENDIVLTYGFPLAYDYETSGIKAFVCKLSCPFVRGFIDVKYVTQLSRAEQNELAEKWTLRTYVKQILIPNGICMDSVEHVVYPEAEQLSLLVRQGKIIDVASRIADLRANKTLPEHILRSNELVIASEQGNFNEALQICEELLCITDISIANHVAALVSKAAILTKCLDGEGVIIASKLLWFALDQGEVDVVLQALTALFIFNQFSELSQWVLALHLVLQGKEGKSKIAAFNEFKVAFCHVPLMQQLCPHLVLYMNITTDATVSEEYITNVKSLYLNMANLGAANLKEANMFVIALGNYLIHLYRRKKEKEAAQVLKLTLHLCNRVDNKVAHINALLANPNAPIDRLLEAKERSKELDMKEKILEIETRLAVHHLKEGNLSELKDINELVSAVQRFVDSNAFAYSTDIIQWELMSRAYMVAINVLIEKKNFFEAFLKADQMAVRSLTKRVLTTGTNSFPTLDHPVNYCRIKYLPSTLGATKELFIWIVPAHKPLQEVVMIRQPINQIDEIIGHLYDQHFDPQIAVYECNHNRY